MENGAFALLWMNKCSISIVFSKVFKTYLNFPCRLKIENNAMKKVAHGVKGVNASLLAVGNTNLAIHSIETPQKSIITCETSKTCLKRPLKHRHNKGLSDKW